MEFLSFNKACQVVGSQGFRTFIRPENGSLYEPFKKTLENGINQKMIVSPHELELLEVNTGSGIVTKVTYYPLSNLPFAGLVREIKITNLSDKNRTFELVDGCPKILPYGINFEHVKVISRHIEGMMCVEKLQGVPFFRLKQTPADIEQVGKLSGGNFYLSFTAKEGLLTNQYILDPFPVFEELENYDTPWGLDIHGFDATLSVKQVLENRTPCAMTGIRLPLQAGESSSLFSVIGFLPVEKQLNEILSNLKIEWFSQKRDENHRIIDEIRSTTFTSSKSTVFDQYCQQTFLENVMRGGMPVMLKSETNRRNFYVFHRQNGDLERDYHWFILEPTYLSQGSSHYRNVLQNRRMDTWFFPQVKDENLFALANLIQTDGYNPLVVQGVYYSIEDQLNARQIMLENGLDSEEWEPFFTKPFTPGSLAMEVSRRTGKQPEELEPFLADMLAVCSENELGEIHEGFWIDHWFYLLDMIEGIKTIYPDQITSYLLDNKKYTYYDNPDIVRPRSMKTVLTSQGYRQYGAVFRDPQKLERIAARSSDARKVRTENGMGEIYTTNLLEKMLCIIANRIASLDSHGVGSEMEAGKPGWCDSLNGLPGLFGSSICGTLEIIRACHLFLSILEETKSSVKMQTIFIELFEFITGLEAALDRSNDLCFDFWQHSHALLENYRAATRLGILGEIIKTPLQQVIVFLEKCLSHIEYSFAHAHPTSLYHSNGVPYTYFINMVTQLESLKSQTGFTEASTQSVKLYQFEQTPMALFLEGPVHYLRVFPENAHQLYSAVKNSPLYDTRLKMYRCCESLDDQPLEIGRIKSYANGWLENGSIYTHMEYKWLLEILKSGLYDEFFTEITHALVPFMDPQIYGRSTFENCSFITSTAFSDQRLHGQAFQPRLSGMTCEFLQMWTLMTAGVKPFAWNGEKLTLSLKPILPEWLFLDEERRISYLGCDGKMKEMILLPNYFAFKFLGKTLTIYHNPERKPTFGPDLAQAREYTLHFSNGDTQVIQGDTITDPTASLIRSGKVNCLIVEMS
jgi:hypothetical protein